MFTDEKLWTSPNGRWYIATRQARTSRYVVVVDDLLMATHYPIKRRDGVIVYDWPYRVPKYVKAQVGKFL